MNKTLKIMMHVVLFAALFAACAAFAAEGGNFFDTAITKLAELFKNVRQVVFVLGAFALVGFAIAAIFGKLQWTKVAILAVGLAILAIASQVLQYAVTEDEIGETSMGIDSLE